MAQPRLPPQVKVIVRDWLNANHVLLTSARGSVLIDSGYGRDTRHMLALLRHPDHLGDAPLDWLVNTHCHSDHMGGNAALQRRYRCRTSIPAAEADAVTRWDTRAMWIDIADQRAERFGFDDAIEPGSVLQMGDLTWQAIAAPGHDMGALVFYSPEERILVSGDALWENGFGIVMPDPPACLQAARTTLETISQLEVRSVIPGHGKPFGGFAQAVDRSFVRLEALEADTGRTARSVLKAMLSFSLLDRGRLPLASLADYLGSVAVYRDLNARFLALPAARLAQLLVDELERAGAVAREDGYLVPR